MKTIYIYKISNSEYFCTTNFDEKIDDCNSVEFVHSINIDDESKKISFTCIKHINYNNNSLTIDVNITNNHDNFTETFKELKKINKKQSAYYNIFSNVYYCNAYDNGEDLWITSVNDCEISNKSINNYLCIKNIVKNAYTLETMLNYFNEYTLDVYVIELKTNNCQSFETLNVK